MRTILIITLSFFTLFSYSQKKSKKKHKKNVETEYSAPKYIPKIKSELQDLTGITPDTVNVSTERTFHIIFPAEIKYINVGNTGCLAAQKINEYPRALRMKAIPGVPFIPTNLTVATEAGKYYTFEVYNNYKINNNYKIIGEEHKKEVGIETCEKQLSHLIFPDKIIYVDFGNNCVEIDKAVNVDNILALKAVKPYYSTTNLSVITESGKFYTMPLSYSVSPRCYSYTIDNPLVKSRIVLLDNKELNTVLRAELEKQVNTYKPKLKIRKTISKAELKLINIFVYKDILLFRFSLSNVSNIDYSVDFIRFYIQDEKIKKKTTVQQLEQFALFSFKMPERVNAHKEAIFTIALNKFTIPDHKKLIIELQEVGVGRHITLRVKNKNIINAEILPLSFSTIY